MWKTIACAVFALAAVAPEISAQEVKKSAPPAAPAGTPAPAGTAGQGWTATTVAEQKTQARVYDDKQLDAIKRVSAYFNAMKDLRAQFVQTNPDAKRQRGKFAVKRPGRFRFDYNLPSKQTIISDGKMLAVQDRDISTDDRYQLDNTPFRMLLKLEVDLLRDANILEVQEAEDLIVITVQDKSPDAPGRIKLFIATKPLMELKEWVTTDAQNYDTRVEVTNVDTKEEIDPKLFDIKSVALEKFQ